MSRPVAVRVIERMLLLGGVALFLVLLRRLGAENVTAQVGRVGWGILLIVGQEVLAIVANTLGWRAAFVPPRPAVAFRRLLAARLAGDAVNYVTPTATLGGEFARVRMLRGSVGRKELLASITVAKLTQTVGQVIFILVGFLAVARELPLDESVRRGVALVLAVLAGVALILVLLQRRGMFAPALRVLQRLGVRHGPGLLQRVEELDAEIARFHGHASGPFLVSTLAFTIGWALGVVEILLILHFLGVPVTPGRAVAIEVLSATIDAVLFFVPAKAGTQEGGKVLIFTLLGLDPATGLALGILRRVRELCWAGIGLLVWSRHHAGGPTAPGLSGGQAR